VGAVRVGIAAALAIAGPAHAQSVADWRPYVIEASNRFGVPMTWIAAVMRAESRGRTTLNGRPIRSSAGAIDLMQLMPSTWVEMRARLGLGTNPDDPHDNILAGTFYLRLMYERFGYPGLFAAYNAGPGGYAEHLAGRCPLPSETIGYLANVASSTPGTAVAVGAASPPPSVFAVHRDVPSIDRDRGNTAPSSPLFIALSQRN